MFRRLALAGYPAKYSREARSNPLIGSVEKQNRLWREDDFVSPPFAMTTGPPKTHQNKISITSYEGKRLSLSLTVAGTVNV